MADQRGVSRVWLALIQQGLKPSRGSIKEEGFDSVGHTSLPQHSAFSTRPSARDANRNGREGRKGNGVKPSMPLRTLRPWR